MLVRLVALSTSVVALSGTALPCTDLVPSSIPSIQFRDHADVPVGSIRLVSERDHRRDAVKHSLGDGGWSREGQGVGRAVGQGPLARQLDEVQDSLQMAL